ncbi:MAG: hypothetical protein ISS19_04895 [Bacteroidales bacterium]|nr:hypothetical protein [Bacteroidales bacterium]
MKEQVYKSGFPSVSRLIAFISLIAVLGFMATVFQGNTSPEEKAIQKEAYQASVDQYESLFVMSVR